MYRLFAWSTPKPEGFRLVPIVVGVAMSKEICDPRPMPPRYEETRVVPAEIAEMDARCWPGEAGTKPILYTQVCGEAPFAPVTVEQRSLPLSKNSAVELPVSANVTEGLGLYVFALVGENANAAVDVFPTLVAAN